MLEQPEARPAATRQPTRVLIADGHAILREGITALLALEPDFEIVAHAGSIDQAARLAERLLPDLIITDLSMPSIDGIQLCREVRAFLLH